jgi:hypothetical protein
VNPSDHRPLFCYTVDGTRPTAKKEEEEEEMEMTFSLSLPPSSAFFFLHFA